MTSAARLSSAIFRQWQPAPRSPIDGRFYEAEWTSVSQEQGLSTLDAYLSAVRTVAFSDLNGRLMLARLPFLKCSDTHYGLLARDLPGGQDAAVEAQEHLESLLRRRERGFTEMQVTGELRSLSAVHSTWTEEMCLSVARTAGTFRLSQAGNVGLAEWETVRVPSRTALLQSALDEGGGRVSVEAVCDRIEAVYGRRPSRGDLSSLGMHVGSRLDGEWVVLAEVTG